MIRINTIHHNKLLPSSSGMLSSSSGMLSSSSGMLSSSSGNAIIVIGNAIIVIGECYHRHRECYHRHRGMLSSSIEARSSFRGLLSSLIEVTLSRSQTYQCRFHGSDITVPTIVIASSRRLFVCLHNTIYYQ